MPDHNDEDPALAQREQHTPDPSETGHLPEGVGRRARVFAIGAVGIVVVVVAAVIATSGGGSSANPASRGETTDAQEVDALLAGIPQSGNVLGSPAAPVTLQYFGDLECSTSRAFTLGVLPSIIADWVRSGELRVEYRSLRTVSEPQVFGVQQVAAIAAGIQDKQWYYLEDFYHEQGREHSGYVTESYLVGLARQAPGLNLAQWADDRRDPRLAAQVTEDAQAAAAAHLHSTPSLLVGATGSSTQWSFDQFAALDPAAVNDAVGLVLQGRVDHGRRVSSRATHSTRL